MTGTMVLKELIKYIRRNLFEVNKIYSLNFLINRRRNIFIFLQVNKQIRITSYILYDYKMRYIHATKIKLSKAKLHLKTGTFLISKSPLLIGLGSYRYLIHLPQVTKKSNFSKKSLHTWRKLDIYKMEVQFKSCVQETCRSFTLNGSSGVFKTLSNICYGAFLQK